MNDDEGIAMAVDFTELQAKNVLEGESSKAEELLRDEDKMDKFLRKLEITLKQVPFVGNDLASVTILAELLNSYVKKEYTEIPLGSLISVIGALLYYVSLIDFIPDYILAVGYIGDLLVIKTCVKLVDSDIEDYKKWRNKLGRQ